MIAADRPGPGFVERRWLADAVARSSADDTTRYVLVTGQPGIGKTTFLRGLVREHPDWLSVSLHHGARDLPSFLLTVGHQLARRRPELFEPERLTVVVHQQVDQVGPDGRMVGIRIGDLAASPFHHTAILEVEQRIARLEGTAHGVEIDRATVDPRLLEPDTLAQLGLIGPAELLLREQPDARIVIVLDALDELAADPGPSALLDWLARGPELPPNLHRTPHRTDRQGPRRLGRGTTVVRPTGQGQRPADHAWRNASTGGAPGITVAATAAPGVALERLPYRSGTATARRPTAARDGRSRTPSAASELSEAELAAIVAEL